MNIYQANKGNLSQTEGQKNENGLILVQKLRYMDMIEILGLLKFFIFMQSILGAFFLKNEYT